MPWHDTNDLSKIHGGTKWITYAKLSHFGERYSNVKCRKYGKRMINGNDESENISIQIVNGFEWYDCGTRLKFFVAEAIVLRSWHVIFNRNQHKFKLMGNFRHLRSESSTWFLKVGLLVHWWIGSGHISDTDLLSDIPVPQLRLTLEYIYLLGAGAVEKLHFPFFSLRFQLEYNFFQSIWVLRFYWTLLCNAKLRRNMKHDWVFTSHLVYNCFPTPLGVVRANRLPFIKHFLSFALLLSAWIARCTRARSLGAMQSNYSCRAFIVCFLWISRPWLPRLLLHLRFL